MMNHATFQYHDDDPLALCPKAPRPQPNVGTDHFPNHGEPMVPRKTVPCFQWFPVFSFFNLW